MDMTATDRLILGHMPMVGVSYQSKEKDDEYRRHFFKIDEMRKLMETALRMGVKRFAAATPSSSPLASLHIRALKHLSEEGHAIKIIPCAGIPIKLGHATIDPFRRWAMYVAEERRLFPEVEQRILNDPILNFRGGWKLKLPASKPYGREDLKRLTIDWKQIEDDLEPFAELPVSHMEPGSETDFLAMADRLDLIGELLDRIKGHGFRRVLLGVHHAGETISRLDEELDGFDGYVTPLNPIGVMMFPTKVSAERAVRRTTKAVYAIKPLAGGRVEPERGFAYVFGFDVEGCVVGTGSVAEAKEDFRTAIKVIKSLNGHVLREPSHLSPRRYEA